MIEINHEWTRINTNQAGGAARSGICFTARLGQGDPAKGPMTMNTLQALCPSGFLGGHGACRFTKMLAAEL